MFDSIKILGLGYAATYAEVKSQVPSNGKDISSQPVYPERTGLNHLQTVQLFKLINNAHEYLRSKLN